MFKISVFSRGLNRLPVLSSTDKACSWTKDHSKALQSYDPMPVRMNPAFKRLFNHYNSTREINKSNEQEVKENLNESAYSKHKKGRHDLIMPEGPREVEITDELRVAFHSIFQQLNANPMQKWLSEVETDALGPCLQPILEKLKGDCLEICEKTYLNYQGWMGERQFRIGGSRIYLIFTYSTNKNPDWLKKK